jgi:hypothetical protein
MLLSSSRLFRVREVSALEAANILTGRDRTGHACRITRLKSAEICVQRRVPARHKLCFNGAADERWQKTAGVYQCRG